MQEKSKTLYLTKAFTPNLFPLLQSSSIRCLSFGKLSKPDPCEVYVHRALWNLRCVAAVKVIEEVSGHEGERPAISLLSARSQKAYACPGSMATQCEAGGNSSFAPRQRRVPFVMICCDLEENVCSTMPNDSKMSPQSTCFFDKVVVLICRRKPFLFARMRGTAN